jgi:hypothetical protein
MYRLTLVAIMGLLSLSRAAPAQEAGGFTVTRGTDTLAVESWNRDDVHLSGDLVRGRGPTTGDRIHYRATLVADESAPLIELSAWRAADPPDQPAWQTVRIIFKDDSVALDEMHRSSGLMTRILPTAPAAIPYLNLSAAFLELATRRAAESHADSLAVPFFNLGGGQTVTGYVRRLDPDSSAVRIGPVEFRLKVDPVGRILGGAVPSQGVWILRTGTD